VKHRAVTHREEKHLQVKTSTWMALQLQLLYMVL
jgi:hypothetical protein